ncbi:MAG TPA: glycosyltransferase family 4 protein, partial [Burkholderiales bacterium]|nr:glycosyltransferase family 4 protein [Burkholderiales bacterium]
MKIAQVAPLAESVPPRLYGGTERVVSYLTEELVRLGHDVTLFATADSQTAARLVACAPRALRLDPEATDALPHHLLMIERVRSLAHEFDVLHFHVEHVHLPLFRPFAHKCVTTLHGRLDLPDLVPLYREFREMPLVSISNAQRRPLAGANWVGTVYHGLPDAVCPYNPAPRGDYLAFLGRISPEKGIEHAIEVAHRAGRRLRIAAKIDSVDEAYWHSRVKPLIGGPIEFVGEVSEEDKPSFLGNATALLFPIDWPEPFGLVMIEAMSCGTPVIAWPRGSVPEIVDHGVTGFITRSVDEAVAEVGRAARLDRARVRRRLEERFSATRMAVDYLAVYRSLGVKQRTELVP